MSPLLDLDHTLSCGQVFRWRKEGGVWKGVVNGRLVELVQRGPDVIALRGMSRSELSNYFRFDDDLQSIYDELSSDAVLEDYFNRFRGLRLIRQEPWECMASYILATNANIPRIQGMIENVCRTFGKEIGGGRFAFPTPAELMDGCERATDCGLGYRQGRFLEFARMVDRQQIDLEGLRYADYDDCVRELISLPGIGNKVADCIAVFCLDHLEAFPVDVRIKRAMKDLYGIEGTYRKVGDRAREMFGHFAGYAQEYIYYAYGR